MNKKRMPVSKNAEHLQKEKVAQALYQLNSGHYKEAIELYKKLLQSSDNDNNEWPQQIAYCYLQRAIAFGARGMYKEATLLWENHSQYALSPYQAYDLYISWLLQTKNQSKIQSCLKCLSSHQLDKQYPNLASLLGLLMITEHPEFQQDLPQDSVFIAHFQIAQSVLQAFNDNNDEKLNKTLKQLPYRSAFKDLRTLLKAVLVSPQSIEQAQSLLTKIPSSSVYSQIAKLLFTCTQNGSELLADLQKLNFVQSKTIAEIKGLNKQQVEFIDHLSREKEGISDKTKFNLAIQYQSLCGTEYAQYFCHTLLTSYPAGQRQFNKNFASTDKFEENRLMALNCDHKNNHVDAAYYWRQCIGILTKSGTNNSLKIAMILRHIAAQQESPEEQVQSLAESLLHDPEDRASYLQILSYYSHQQDTLKDYKQWLAKTLDRFPQDIEVLSQAIRIANSNKAYKKASLFALKILKFDPLNIFAKQTLFSNHLAHARRLIRDKKYHLVEKEIQQARNLKSGKNNTLQTDLIQSLFCFAAQDKKQGLQLITQALVAMNSTPVNIQFQAAMEALLTGLPVATIIRDLPLAKDHLLSKQGLSQLIQLIDQYIGAGDDYHPLLSKALDIIKPALKNSLLKQDYDEDLLLAFCQTMDKANDFGLLRYAAKIALVKWQKPIWVYYQIYSDTNGIVEKCISTNILKLQQNQKEAMYNKDHRALLLTNAFLDRYYQAYPHRSMGFLDGLFEVENEQIDEFEDPIVALFNHIPEKKLKTLNKKLQVLTKKTSPERLAQELSIVVGQNNNLLFSMMEQPDLFTALLVIKAAEISNVNIDVSLDDVLNYFSLSQNNNTNPF